MEVLHTMIRVSDVKANLDFYVNKLGFKKVRESNNEKGKFSLYFLEADGGGSQIELTHNWDSNEVLEPSRLFGHIAIGVDNIYDFCADLQKKGVEINRPPRDGRIAFVKSPDGVSIELVQKGEKLAEQEPWASMENKGTW